MMAEKEAIRDCTLLNGEEKAQEYCMAVFLIQVTAE